jgi:hypothetical protein
MTKEEIISDIKWKLKTSFPAVVGKEGFVSLGHTQKPSISIENLYPADSANIDMYSVPSFDFAIDVIKEIYLGDLNPKLFTVDKTKPLFICLEIK